MIARGIPLDDRCLDEACMACSMQHAAWSIGPGRAPASQALVATTWLIALRAPDLQHSLVGLLQ